MTVVRRRAAEAMGRRSEAIAVGLLRLKGYSILARRLRLPSGEIDVVARRGRTLVAVEVKARRDAQGLRDLIAEGQWRRICRSLEAFAGRRRLNHLRMRFDVILVRRGWRPFHRTDAWRPS